MKTKAALAKTITKGFTLIELLIVIAILGILAIVVLSALNPIEQINKSRDSGYVSDSEQLVSAIDRYYASKALYPWQNVPGDTKVVTLTAVTAGWGVTGCTAATTCALANLSTNSTELKQSFVDRIKVFVAPRQIFVHQRGNIGDATYGCFNPQSKSFAIAAQARCAAGLPSDLTAQSTTICPVSCTAAAPETCMYCLP